MKYEIVNDTTIAISYWINDVYKGLVNYPKASYESDLKYYTIFSQEGSAWFDNIRLRKAASIEPTVTIDTPLTQQSKAWTRWGYDLAQNRYYPYPSNTQVSISDFSEYWSIQSSADVLTEDINGDGFLEIVLTDGSSLRAYDNTGTELWNTTTTSWINLIADVTGDNVPEIITSQRSGTTLQMHVYDNTGTLLNTISKSGGYDSSWSAISAADYDEDGDIEILVHQNAGYSRDPRGVSMFDYGTATELWYYDAGPYEIHEALGDFNEDGLLDVVRGGGTWHNGASGSGVNGTATMTTDSDLYSIAFSAIDGSEIFTVGYTADGQSDGYIDHAIVDLDHDGNYSILVFESHDPTYYPGTSQIHMMSDTGTIIDTYNGPSNVYWWFHFAIGDLNNDGYDEIAVADDSGTLRILNHNLDMMASKTVVSVKCIECPNT